MTFQEKKRHVQSINVWKHASPGTCNSWLLLANEVKGQLGRKWGYEQAGWCHGSEMGLHAIDDRELWRVLGKRIKWWGLHFGNAFEQPGRRWVGVRGPREDYSSNAKPNKGNGDVTLGQARTWSSTWFTHSRLTWVKVLTVTHDQDVGSYAFEYPTVWLTVLTMFPLCERDHPLPSQLSSLKHHNDPWRIQASLLKREANTLLTF